MNLQCLDVARAALGEPARQHGDESYFHCSHPQHSDRDPSLQVNAKKNVWMCGPCAAGGNAWQLAAFIARLSPDDKSAVVTWLKEKGLSNSQDQTGLTLSAYAKAKKLPEDFLQGVGLQDTRYDGKPALHIPYYDATGKKIMASRFRLCMTGEKEKKFRWKKGSQALPYGLPFLNEAGSAGYLVIVEGESDCHTLWFHGIPAVGIPGVATWKNEWAERFANIPVINVVIEPDRGGETLRDKLLASPLHNRLGFVTLSSAKDPSELYLRDPTEFRRAWDAAIKGAVSPPKTDGSALLDDVVQFIRRFVALTEAQAYVIALWVAHTHAFGATDTTPYLAVNSAEKQCGKTRLLEVLNLLVANPWLTSRVSAAVLVRKVDAEVPTLLLDESDAAFKGPEEYSEALRGILNSGHGRRCGTTSLCVGHGKDIQPQDFSTFCPKAIAGIGNLPDTIADRSIPIRLKRRAPQEPVERFRERTVSVQARPIRQRLQVWANAKLEDLRQAEPPELPESLSDRQQDGAEPLVAIADLIGGEWPQRARSCLVDIFNSSVANAESIGTRLLVDIKTVFDSREQDRISSKELCQALGDIETSPWGEWSKGKPITPIGVSKLLAPFGIVPGTTRFGTDTAKGYVREVFAETWNRYLPKAQEVTSASNNAFQNVTTSQPAPDAGSAQFSKRNAENDVTAQNVQKSASNGPCDVVTFQKPNIGTKRVTEAEI